MPAKKRCGVCFGEKVNELYIMDGGIPMDLFDKANFTIDRVSFLDFLEALKNDFIANPETWENHSIDTYLDAIKSWIKDYDGQDINVENLNWKSVAAIFYMGKIYE